MPLLEILVVERLVLLVLDLRLSAVEPLLLVARDYVLVVDVVENRHFSHAAWELRRLVLRRQWELRDELPLQFVDRVHDDTLSKRLQPVSALE